MSKNSCTHTSCNFVPYCILSENIEYIYTHREGMSGMWVYIARSANCTLNDGYICLSTMTWSYAYDVSVMHREY